MKTTILLLLIQLLTLSNLAFAQNPWFQQISGTSNDLYGVSFSDTITGYAVGEGGVIIKTTNGGAGWFPQASGTSLRLRGMYMLNKDSGYAVGFSGTIRKTTNGGVNWFALSSGVTNSLTSVFAVNASTVYICGSSGLLQKSTNGGINWTTQSTGASDTLTSVYFLNANTGSVVGKQGTVRRTTNGGTNWFAQTVSVIGNLTGVYLNNSTNGIISIGHTNMAFYRSTNSGTNWISQYYGSDNTIRSIDFVDSSFGFMGGDVGNFYTTENGGANWSRNPIGVTNWIYCISFPTRNVGWVVGTNGMIMRTNTGGANIPAAPSNLLGFPISGSKIFLSWFDNSSGEQGFKIERSTNDPNNFSLIGSVGPNNLNYIDSTNLIYGQTYYYRVNAYTAAGNSPYSNTALVLLTGITSISVGIPEKHALHNNYPNPFNPATKIKFDLPQNGRVKLIIFDISGKEITRLVDSDLDPGYYEIDWNALNYSSGMYFYRLETSMYSVTKKMMLIK